MNVFVTGGTGYLGRAFIADLIRRGHDVRALVRQGSERKLPSGAHAVVGDVLGADTWASALKLDDILVHLVGTPHPNPSKARQFRDAARQEGEQLVRASGIPATILRPWYVLGPGHRWPYLLLPLYGLLAMIPATAQGARRLGLVTHRQMVAALARAVESVVEPVPDGVRVVTVPEIRVAASPRRAPSADAPGR